MSRVTADELIRKLQNLDEDMLREVRPAMEKACHIGEAESKKNCTPGESPYDWMIFESKVYQWSELSARKAQSYAHRGGTVSPEGVTRSGAPFDTGTLRRSITSETQVLDKEVRGVVGTNLDYALPVHEGTSTMQARPFILDAMIAKREDIIKTLSDGLRNGLRREV